MDCPNCRNGNTSIIVYGHCVDEHGFEYPYDPRIYEAGSSLPAWGMDGEVDKGTGIVYNENWPIRYCRKCDERFDFKHEQEAFCISYQDAIRMSYEK